VTTPRIAHGVFWWYSTENASPRVTAKFLARQRRLLMPTQYAREHENAWVDAADSFTTAAEVDRAMASGWAEQGVGLSGVDYEAFGDLGAVHDPTVLCVGHAEPGGLIVIDRLDTLQGSREAPVQIAAVEARIRDLASRFRLVRCRIESWQGLALAQSLAGLGAELFTPTQRSNAEEWPLLAHHLAAGTLVLFPHARLREELLNLSYELGPMGVRVLDRRAVHQDHAVAVRGVVASLSARTLAAAPPTEMTPAEYAEIRRAMPGLDLAPMPWGGLENVVVDHEAGWSRE